MSAPVDRSRLRQAIADARSRQAGRDSYRTLLADAAEAHLATLPEPKDCFVVKFWPDGNASLLGWPMTRAEAERRAVREAKDPSIVHALVVQRPA